MVPDLRNAQPSKVNKYPVSSIGMGRFWSLDGISTKSKNRFYWKTHKTVYRVAGSGSLDGISTKSKNRFFGKPIKHVHYMCHAYLPYNYILSMFDPLSDSRQNGAPRFGNAYIRDHLRPLHYSEFKFTIYFYSSPFFFNLISSTTGM